MLTPTSDHEIFRLRDELEIHEGPDVTFYGKDPKPVLYHPTTIVTCHSADFLGIKPSASQEEVNKAYRKRSRTLHPDRAKQSFIASRAQASSSSSSKDPNKKPSKPGVHVAKPPTEREIRAAIKDASERFTRLGLIANILRGEGRARYDHFLANGFPTWRGTGYYYARYRPGLGATLFGLFAFAGGLLHYVVLIVGWKRQREFVGRYVRQARKAAWGEESSVMASIPGVDTAGTSATAAATSGSESGGGGLLAEDGHGATPLNRRERRMQAKDSKRGKDRRRSRSAARRDGARDGQADGVTPEGPRRRVQAENGKILVADGAGNVFLEEEDDDGEVRLFLLDPEGIPRPTFRQTVLWRLPAWAVGLAREKFLGGGAAKDEATADEVVGAAGEEPEVVTTNGDVDASAARQRKRKGKIRR